jgi:hypothetical protein
MEKCQTAPKISFQKISRRAEEKTKLSKYVDPVH